MVSGVFESPIQTITFPLVFPTAKLNSIGMAEDSFDVSGGQEQLIIFPSTDLSKVKIVFSCRRQNITFNGKWVAFGY